MTPEEIAKKYDLVTIEAAIKILEEQKKNEQVSLTEQLNSISNKLVKAGAITGFYSFDQIEEYIEEMQKHFKCKDYDELIDILTNTKKIPTRINKHLEISKKRILKKNKLY